MTKQYPKFKITEQEIDSALRYLRFEKGEKDATKEDAIALLEDFNALAHMMAHKLVEDEKSGKIKQVKLKKKSKRKNS
jgi:hypothetical protein